MILMRIIKMKIKLKLFRSAVDCEQHTAYSHKLIINNAKLLTRKGDNRSFKKR